MALLRMSSLDRLLAWLDFQHGAERFVGDRVDEPVGPRLYFTDSLPQLAEEQLASGGLALRVELHALDVLAGVVAHSADEGVALPLRKLVAVVERQAGDRNRRHPEHDWIFDS